MTPFSEFTAVRPVTFEMPSQSCRDLLCTDFGLDDEFAMQVRETILKAKTQNVLDVDIEMHADGLAALSVFLRHRYPGIRHDSEGSWRRLHRLGIRAEQATGKLAMHPWMQGLALRGKIHEIRTGWTDGFFLRAFRMRADSFRPVILLPRHEQQATGFVTRFTMTEVEWDER